MWTSGDGGKTQAQTSLPKTLRHDSADARLHAGHDDADCGIVENPMNHLPIIMVTVIVMMITTTIVLFLWLMMIRYAG